MIIRVHVIVSRQSGAGVLEDEALTTHDFNLGIGTTEAERDTHTTNMENRIDAYFTALRPYMRAVYSLTELRFYELDTATGLFGEPYRVTGRNVAGTNATSPQLPPQIALSVTERTPVRKRWGRFYIPGLVVATMNDYGRPTSGTLTIVADAVDAWYQGSFDAGALPVVLGAPNVDGDRVVSPITLIQVDDVFDVIRRRRFENTTLRVQRDVA